MEIRKEKKVKYNNHRATEHNEFKKEEIKKSNIIFLTTEHTEKKGIRK